MFGKRFLAAALVGSFLPAPVAASGPSLREAAEAAARSGAFRAQNTSDITTGLIRDDDDRRSAIAYGLSGAMAFAGAALWRWLPCRNVVEGPTKNATEAAKFSKCYEPDGSRKPFEPPTKALLGAGIALEFVSLFYLMRHLRGGGSQGSSSP